MRFTTLLAAALFCGSAFAQKDTTVRFALDWRFEGPPRPTSSPSTRATTRPKASTWTVDPGSGSVEGINRVASGAYEVGFADINSLVKYATTRATCR